jgi:subtilisin family serine protease
MKPDVVAPGVGVWTVDPATTDQYLQGNGTSFAAPLTAGVAALVLQARAGTGAFAMRDRLRATASKADLPTNDYGWGLLQGFAAAYGDAGGACGAADGASADGGPGDAGGADGGGTGRVETTVEGGCSCEASGQGLGVAVLWLSLMSALRRARRASPPCPRHAEAEHERGG